MSKKKNPSAKNFSPDWFVRGLLGKIGETFDRLTGRNWKPSSSLATSELIEKLKGLLDSEVRDLGEQGKFVPHNLKLKMQWNKFSTDSEDSLQKLHNELLIAAIDHINDSIYHTFEPLNLQIRPDYFTEGVKLLASFDKSDQSENEAELNITLPQTKVNDLFNQKQKSLKPLVERFIARFSMNNADKEIILEFSENKRIIIGRTKESDLVIEDSSISKIHAALVLTGENQLSVADTGSTNGTFINDERIAYGKAFPVETGAKVKFGTVEVAFAYVPKPTEILSAEDLPQNDSVEINGFEFRSKTDTQIETDVKTDQQAERHKAEDVILQPIEKSSNLSESFNPKQNAVSNPEEKADFPNKTQV